MRAQFAAAVVIAAALLGSGAQGQSPKTVSPQAGPPDNVVQAFAAADVNGDGVLDATEFERLPISIRDKAVDANGDGLYSLSETDPAPMVRSPPDPLVAAGRSEFAPLFEKAFREPTIGSIGAAGKTIIRVYPWVYDQPGLMLEFVAYGRGGATMRVIPTKWDRFASTITVRLDDASWRGLQDRIRRTSERGSARVQLEREGGERSSTRPAAVNNVDAEYSCLRDGGVDVDMWEGGRPVGFPGLHGCHLVNEDVGIYLLEFARGRAPGCGLIVPELLQHEPPLRPCMFISGETASATAVLNLFVADPRKEALDISFEHMAKAGLLRMAGRPSRAGPQAKTYFEGLTPGRERFVSTGHFRGLSPTRVEMTGEIGSFDEANAPARVASFRQTWAKTAEGWRIVRWDVEAMGDKKRSQEREAYSSIHERWMRDRTLPGGDVHSP